jgi:molybdopterin/thiamine biosynthesis adenylyltransferase
MPERPAELSPAELERYGRQILIRQVGLEGQKRLKQARVIIAGAGGLGSPIAMYLAAAGVGTLRLIDCDLVQASNLNRQLLHWQEDLGRPKVESARGKLTRLNPDIEVEVSGVKIDAGNAPQLVSGFDAIVDAMDNMAARYALNQAAIANRIPFFHGAVNGFEGQVMSILPGKSACLRCLAKHSPSGGVTPVIGVTPGIIGAIQAAEVIKYLTGQGELLAGRMIRFDGLAMEFREFRIKPDPGCDHCGRLFENK